MYILLNKSELKIHLVPQTNCFKNQELTYHRRYYLDTRMKLVRTIFLCKKLRPLIEFHFAPENNILHFIPNRNMQPRGFSTRSMNHA